MRPCRGLPWLPEYARLPIRQSRGCMVPVLVIGIVVLLGVALAMMLRQRHQRQRQLAVAELLDAADGLEARLREARVEIESVSDSADDPVQEALREMLRQRLWVQQHGKTASLADLRRVRDAIRQARERVERQLARVELARAVL